jgi:hypothetical protein
MGDARRPIGEQVFAPQRATVMFGFVTTYRGSLWVLVDETEHEVEANCTVRYRNVPTSDLSSSLNKTMQVPQSWDGRLTGSVDWLRLRTRDGPIALRGPSGRQGEALITSVSGSTAEIAGSGDPPFEWE